MKKLNLKGKLNLRKESLSKFDLDQVNGGAQTDYSQCGTAYETVICCATLEKTCNTKYAICGTGPQTLVKTC
jgi:hypothetical protein